MCLTVLLDLLTVNFLLLSKNAELKAILISLSSLNFDNASEIERFFTRKLMRLKLIVPANRNLQGQ